MAVSFDFFIFFNKRESNGELTISPRKPTKSMAQNWFLCNMGCFCFLVAKLDLNLHSRLNHLDCFSVLNFPFLI